MGVMPALVERDFAAFGAAVTAIQTLVGDHFAPAQGGVFTSKRVEALARRLVEAGAVGIGQSSWGPTGFAFAPSEERRARHGRRGPGDGRSRDRDQDRARAGTPARRSASTGLDLVGS